MFESPPAVVIVIYLLAVLAVGAYSRKIKGLVDFHLAGRGITILPLIGTFCATIIGASSTMGMAGLGFKNGLPGAWWMLSGTAGLLVLAAFFAGRVRETGCYTLPELVGTFYGQRARFAAALLIVISWIGVIAVQIQASGKVLGAVIGGDQILFMAVCASVFVLYTAHGGQSSVIRTDLVQLLIILAGMIVLFTRAWEAAGSELLSGQSFPTSPQMGGWDVLSMLAVVGSAYLVGPDMHSRMLSAHSPREARASAAISALVLIPLAFIITSLGIFAHGLYPAASPEDAIPLLMTGLLSSALQGLVAAAMLAAFMSSADTSLMTATSIFTLDIFRKVFAKSGEQRLMLVSRISVAVIGLAALALAVSMPGIIKILMIAYTIFTSGLLLPVIAGFYKERLGITSSGAMGALAGGGITAILFGQNYPLMGMAVSAALLFGISWLERMLRRQGA
jgi:SSS family solute:Na+ symporter